MPIIFNVTRTYLHYNTNICSIKKEGHKVIAAVMTMMFSSPIAAVNEGGPIKRQGKIVFMSSMAGTMASAYKGLYASSKHAVEAIAKSLRQEMEAFNVQVATINPGPFDTGFNDRAVEEKWEWFDSEKHHTSVENLKESEQGLDQQYDPQMMIDKMVEVIPKDHHKFRTAYPEDTAENMRKEEQDNWDIEI